MPLRLKTILAILLLGSCSYFPDTETFSVYFQPYGSELDQQAIETIQAAAHFARAHPMQPVSVAGFAAQPDPGRDVDGLSAQRADIVKQALVGDGVSATRVTTAANGITDPKTLPQVAVRRVDIAVGPQPSSR